MELGEALQVIRDTDAKIAANRSQAEIERLTAEIAELKTPNWYWDDRDLDSAVAPEEAAAYDDVGDIIPLRPIHELPTRWALVTDEGLVWFDSREAAEAAERGE